MDSKLRYANEVIFRLESENQAVNMDTAALRAAVDTQQSANNQIRNNFYLA